MSFVILRHGKIKSAGKNAAIGHNHRLGEQGEKINIDASKAPLNRSLMGPGAMDRLNAKLPGKMRKDAVVAVETVVSASPEFFDGIEKDRAKLLVNPKFKKWVADTQSWMKKEWGSNVVDAVLHMDESTPHIHFLTVPLIKDRLCAKEFLGIGVMQRHQGEYAAAMASHGLERGIPVTQTKRRHIGLKEAPGSGGQASQLAAQLAATQAELGKVQLRFDRLNVLSMGDVKAISELKEKVAKLEAENKALEAKVAVLASPSLEQAQEEPQEAIEALPDQWVGIPVATKLDAAVGAVIGIYGRQVVLHVGRGKHVLHEVPLGQPMPKLQQTEQQKGGVGR